MDPVDAEIFRNNDVTGVIMFKKRVFNHQFLHHFFMTKIKWMFFGPPMFYKKGPSPAARLFV